MYSAHCRVYSVKCRMHTIYYIEYIWVDIFIENGNWIGVTFDRMAICNVYALCAVWCVRYVRCGVRCMV